MIEFELCLSYAIHAKVEMTKVVDQHHSTVDGRGWTTSNALCLFHT